MKSLQLTIAIRNIVIVLFLILVVSCQKDEKENQMPTASFVISPNTGTSETLFQFDANSSSDDNDDISELQVRWQWENGGPWTNWTSVKTASHTFGSSGEKEITLDVIDTEGLVGSTKQSITLLYALTVNISPDGAGSVLINPDLQEYQQNAEVNLTASPNVGYYFSEWSGDASGSLNPTIITMNSDKLINAIFEEGVFEDFDDGVADNFITDGSGRWSVSNMTYIMTGTSAYTTAYSYYPLKYTYFEFSVDMKAINSTTASHAHGIYFKSQDGSLKTNSYRLSISQEGNWHVGKYVDGVFSYITGSWIYSADLNTGLNSINNIKIALVGTQLDIYFNDVYQGYVSNMTTFSSGYLGIHGYDSDVSYNTFVYDNFRIVPSAIKKSKSTTQNDIDKYDLRKIKGTKGDPDGNNF